MTDGDRSVALKGRTVDPDSHERMRYVVIPPERYDGLLQRGLEPHPVDGASQPVGHPALADVRRRHAGRLARLRRGEPAFAQALAAGSRQRPRLPDPGLSPVPRAGHAARARARGEDRALLPHAVRRRHVPARAAGHDAHGTLARHGRSRRARLPVEAVGRELPALRAEPARAARASRRAPRDRRPGRGRALLPGRGERRAVARDGEPARGRRGARGAAGLGGRCEADAARRPPGAFEEHPAWLPRLRAVPAPQPVLGGLRALPLPVQPVARGRARVPELR